MATRAAPRRAGEHGERCRDRVGEPRERRIERRIERRERCHGCVGERDNERFAALVAALDVAPEDVDHACDLRVVRVSLGARRVPTCTTARAWGQNRAMIAPIMRRTLNGAHTSAHASPDRVARAVQIVSWLMGRQAGDTFAELRHRFGWQPDELRDVLDHLAQRCQVARVGERYLATPEHTWRPSK